MEEFFGRRACTPIFHECPNSDRSPDNNWFAPAYLGVTDDVRVIRNCNGHFLVPHRNAFLVITSTTLR